MLVALCLSNCSKKTDPPGNESGSGGNQNLQIPSPSPTPTERDVGLKEALDRKFVAATICGVGASSGSAIVIAIKSLVEDRLNIKVDEALTARNGDGNYQDMVLEKVEGEYDSDKAQKIADKCVEAAERVEEQSEWKKVSRISLAGYDARVYALSAYCLDFEKENPSSGNTFTLADDAHPETRAIFSYVRQHPNEFEVESIQLATWAVNGNFGTDDILPKFSFTETNRSEACRLLKYAGIDAAKKKLCAN
jgi:hypothetical protein